MTVDPVGVLIVNFNSGPFLRRCLDSVLASTVPLHVIVVDNNSADASVDSIRSLDPVDHRLEIISHPDNVGFSAAVNIGRARLSGNRLLLLNPDCTVHPHTIERLDAILESSAETGLVGPLVFNENGTEQRGCRRNEPTLQRSMVTALGLARRFEGVDQTGEQLPTEPIAVDAVSGACLLIDLPLFDRIGGMDEAYFLHCEDLDLCRRVRDAGRTVLFVPSVSIFHRQGGSGGAGFAQIEKLKHRGMLRYYARHNVDGSGMGSALRKTGMQALVWGHYAMALGIHQINKLRERRRGSDGSERLCTPLDSVDLVLSGANSDVGDRVLEKLNQQARTRVVVQRKPESGKATSVADRGTRYLALSFFDKAPPDDQPRFTSWLQLAPIWSSESFVAMIERTGITQITALSSTSVVAKAQSKSANDQQVVGALARGERSLVALAERNNCRHVILRPTLIYGGPRNRNINLVRRLIRLTGRFPIVGAGGGKRQPVHADEVADACLQAMDSVNASGIYDLPGGETLTYRQMIERVFASLGRTPKLIRVSEQSASRLLSVLRHVPGLGAMSSGVGRRMSLDQVFDDSSAQRDFGYQPGQFRP